MSDTFPPITGRWTKRRRRSASVVVCTAALLSVTFAGCSSSGSSSSSSTSPASGSSTTYPAGKQQICGARDQLKTSVQALAKPALLVQGTDAIKSAVDKVRSDLQAVKAAAKSDYATEVDALQTSLQHLQTSVGNLGNGNVTQNLQAVGTDIADVGTSAQALFSKLDASCS